MKQPLYLYDLSTGKRDYAPKTATQYSDATARGQVRLWKQQLTKQYRQFEHGFHDNAQTQSAINALVHKTGVGRRRAFDRISRLFGPGPTLAGVRLQGGMPIAVWSILKPRDSLREADDRNCVTVNYIISGVFPDQRGLLSGNKEGMWTLEVVDHALGRVLERMGITTPLAPILAEAHYNLLRLRTATVLPNNDFTQTPQFLLRAGAGAFICEVRTGQDISAGYEAMFYIRAATWIADDMAHDDQVILVPDGQPGERLIDGWLLPQPVRHIHYATNKRIAASSRVIGMSDLLAPP